MAVCQLGRGDSPSRKGKGKEKQKEGNMLGKGAEKMCKMPFFQALLQAAQRLDELVLRRVIPLRGWFPWQGLLW